MQSTLNSFYNMISSVVGGFFDLQIASGISLGFFLFSAFILGEFINFLFRKVVR